MTETAVDAYHIMDTTGYKARVSREHLIYLCGKGIITNVVVAIDRGNVILRTTAGQSLASLPVVDSKTGKVRGEEKAKPIVLSQFKLTARIMEGTKNVGYVATDPSGAQHKLTREQVFKLAQSNQISNASAQRNEGKLLLRGEGISLRSLPEITVETKKPIAALELVAQVKDPETGLIKAFLVMDYIKNKWKELPLPAVRRLASEGKISNARVASGKLCGSGIRLGDLPIANQET